MTRSEELAANLAAVRQRIAGACSAADRDPDEITLIVVTKTYPVSDVLLLRELGVRHIGENRHPEAGEKHDSVLESLAGSAAASNSVSGQLTWHFVGGLQTNKAKDVARYADVVHSVDRLKLVNALDKGAGTVGRTIECLAQIALSRDESRSGAPPELAEDIARAIDTSSNLTFGGVMAVAPLDADPDDAFAELAETAKTIRAEFPGATIMSAGMSADMESAVRAGATHLRIGRSVLGERSKFG